MLKRAIKSIGGVVGMLWTRLNLTVAAVMVWTWTSLTAPAMADSSGGNTVNIGTGLTPVDPGTMAGDVKYIALGISALAGVVALGALAWIGIGRMWNHSAQGRADNREWLIDVFKGFGITGLASLLVGFAAFLIQKAQGG